MFSILLCDLDYKAFNRFLDSSRIVHVLQKRVDRSKELYRLNLKLLSLLFQIISNLTIMDVDVEILFAIIISMLLYTVITQDI